MEKKIAIACGGFLIAFGFLGFVPNPLVGPGAFFEANHVYNVARIVFGAFLLGVSTLPRPMARTWLQIAGTVYFLRAILGFVFTSPEGFLFQSLATNTADDVLHIVIGILLILPTLFPNGFPKDARTESA